MIKVNEKALEVSMCCMPKDKAKKITPSKIFYKDCDFKLTIIFILSEFYSFDQRRRRILLVKDEEQQK